MNWPFDPSASRVTPEIDLGYLCKREGITWEQLALPRVMVATFQEQSYARLVEQTAAVPSGPPTVGSFLAGKTPRSARPVTVRRFPFGAPATATVLETAIARGVREILVCGAAGSLQPALPLGSTVVVTAAEREDGTSHHYLPAGEPTLADPGLTAALERAGRELGALPTLGRAWTTDAPYRETESAIRRHQAAGVAVVEMEAAAIFAVARVRDVRAGLIVAISDEVFGPWNSGFHLPAYQDALAKAADTVLLAADLLSE